MSDEQTIKELLEKFRAERDEVSRQAQEATIRLDIWNKVIWETTNTLDKLKKEQ